MNTVPADRARPEPIVIHRSISGNGETFAVDMRSLKRLREAFGGALHVRPRVFIAYSSQDEMDPEHVQNAIAPQVVLLLTGLSEERLQPLGGVIFRDPVTDEDLARTP